MSDQSNLPKFQKYGKIKEVTIKKVINIDTHKNQYEYYYISFVEVVEKEEKQRILFKKKKIIVAEEVKRIVPFSFKSLEEAKDFAQYLPGMSLKGFRFSKDFNKFNISYETYKILIENIDTPIYIKFIKDTEHQRVHTKKQNGEITRYYGNDLDISPDADEPSGEFYQYNEIIVDYFFTDVAWDTDHKCIIPNMEKSISEIKNYENENTHKFVLVEQ